MHLARWRRLCCSACCHAAEGRICPTQLAEDGYAVLAERLREPAERAMVADVLQKILNAQVGHPCMSTSEDGLVLLCT